MLSNIWLTPVVEVKGTGSLELFYGIRTCDTCVYWLLMPFAQSKHQLGSWQVGSLF